MKKAIIGFALGVVVGFAASVKYAEKQYKKIIDEEIESIKKVFGEKYKAKAEKARDENLDDFKSTPTDYKEVLKDLGYEKSHTDYSGYSKKEDEVMKMTPGEKPYKISVHEFGVYDHYTQISCLYFIDKVLVEEANLEMLEDVDDAVGLDCLKEFEDEYIDAVYVRNDRLQVDYEILRDYRTYTEAIKIRPQLQED